jgi:selenocysteine-specific elongation factor
VQQALAGQRTAVNFQGLEKAAIERGDTLAFPGTLNPSYMVDVSLLFLKSNKKALKNRTRVRFHTGTSEILGNLILLDREEIKPGEETVAQLRLDAPVSLVKDDRYVVRSYSPVRTIGGGAVLNPIPPKHKRFRKEVIEGLNRINQMSSEELVAFCVDRSGYRGATFNDLVVMTNIVEKPLEQAIQALLSRKQIIQVDKDSRLLIHANSFEALQQQLRQTLAAYHKANPLRTGIQKEELRSKIPSTLNAKVFTLLLNQMIKDEQIAAEEDTVRLFTHKISLGADQENIRQRILSEYGRSGLQPPWFKELSAELNTDPARAVDVLRLLVEEGQLVKVKEDLYFAAAVVKDLQQRLVEFLTRNGEISTPQFKEMTGVSRKYVIPLIEYFDARNLTIRIGDIRKLRKGS